MSDYSDEDILKYLDEMAGYTPSANDNPNYYSSSGSNMVEAPAETSGYDYLTQYADMFFGTGAIDQQSGLGQTLAQATGNPNQYSTSKSNMTVDSGDDNREESVIDRLTGGIKKAYEKDPLAFLKMGLETVGGAIKSQRDRETADRLARSRIDEQNNAAAINVAEKKAYSDSFSYKQPRQPKKQTPLSRVGGGQIYDAQGRVIRS